MTWDNVSDDLTKENFDEVGDDPSQARIELVALIDKVKVMLAEAVAIKDEAQTFLETVTLDVAARQLIIKAKTSDGAGIQFNADPSSPATEDGFVGFNAGKTDIIMENKNTGGHANIKTVGAGELRHNGSKVHTTANFSKIYDIEVGYIGEPDSTTTIAGVVINRNVTLPVNLTGSVARCETPPGGGSVILSLHKNGTEIATITFADIGTTGTFVMAGEQNLMSGDRLTVVSPSNAWGIADIFITLAATHDS